MVSHKYKVNPLVLVGLPTLADRPMSWEWTDAYMSLQLPLGASVSRLRIKGQKIADARNQIALEALQQNADYVLFIGDDVLPPANIFEMLRRHRKDIVTGVYWTKQYPTTPYLWKNILDGPFLDWKAGEFHEIDWCGVDATLIATDVFRRMEPPFFSHEWVFEEGQEVLPIATEDLYFYSKAKAAGFKVYVDTAVQCHHQDRTTGRFYGLTMDMPQAKPTEPHPDTKEPVTFVADIGAGHDTPHFGFNARVTRYDGDPDCHPDVICDIRAIPAKDETFDGVHARHVLEHFAQFETESVMREWLRILKPGGTITINVPNIEYAAREILKGDESTVGIYPLWQFFGHQNGSAGEVHRIAFTARGLLSLFQFLGLDNITVREVGEFGESLVAVGTKVASNKPVVAGELLRQAWQREDAERAETRDITATIRAAEAAQEEHDGTFRPRA